MKDQEASQIASNEAMQIGLLTNAGFRVVVASVWTREETKTAAFLYAAAWNENEVEVLLHHGDRIASSHELYRALGSVGDDSLTCSDLIDFCRRSKL
jgi:hypothetical protein